MPPAIELRVASAGYPGHAVLRDIGLVIRAGERIAVMGRSGAGKTTLLNLIGCMDVPSAGRLWVEGRETSRLRERELTRLRRQVVGFVFQHFGLIPTLTVAENVALPALFAGQAARERVGGLLERVGLASRASHRPHQLSGGEMQRAAIARALINNPRLILADEPTGNLDSATGATILQIFRDLQKEGLTIVVVTHNPGLAAAADRQLCLRDGRLDEDDRTEASTIQQQSQLPAAPGIGPVP
jgi:ABC-type lipoprotein export system ATPase subunit